VALYGGFAGGETQLNQRDWEANSTVLSGDLLGDDGPEFGNRGDNVYQVLLAVGAGDPSVLDGFIIRGGYADGPGFGATPASRDQGSGVNIYDASPRIENCVFEDNWAVNHGTINDHGHSTVINCLFRNNYSAQFGAGLYIHHHSMTMAMGCRFENNVAVAEGAGAYSRSMHGAMLMDCQFSGNRAERGAGMYNAADSETMIANCEFNENTAVLGGGGIYADLASPMIVGCRFWRNSAGGTITTGGGGGGGSGGGGIWTTGGDAVVMDCEFVENTASFGGGVYGIEESRTLVTDCFFEANLAHEAGGLYSLLSTMRVQDCDFHGNAASGGDFSVGGGVSLYFSNTDVEGCLFVGNEAELGGGGLYSEGETPVIRNCIFRANRSMGPNQGWGGAIMNGYNGAPRIEQCEIVGNTARQGGGIFSMFQSNGSVVASSIVANVADAGGGFYSYSSSFPAAANCVFWGNAGGEIAGELAAEYCCVEGGRAGPGNVGVDPLFTRDPSPGPDGLWGTPDDDFGDLLPREGSSMVDAGNRDAVPVSLEEDLSGRPRFHDDAGWPNLGIGFGPLPDIGAHESQGQSCYANCDLSEGRTLSAADFVCFMTRFTAGDPRSNCDGSFEEPRLNVNDFVCFMTRYAAGCAPR
jgi:predicted outer membrane repeat protein